MNIMRDQGSTETAEELAKDIGHSVDRLVRVGLQMNAGGIWTEWSGYFQGVGGTGVFRSGGNGTEWKSDHEGRDGIGIPVHTWFKGLRRGAGTSGYLQMIPKYNFCLYSIL